MLKIVQNKIKQSSHHKCLYLGILGCKFEKVWSYFQHSRICQNATFRVKLKILNFGTKNAWFRCCYIAILKKNYYHIWNQLLWICLVAKFGAKLKIFKFGTKNTWFCYFWVRILKKYYYIMKSLTPSILPNCKILRKMSTFGTTNALFGYFWARILKKTIVIFEISTLKFVNLKILQKKKKKSPTLWLKMSYFIFGYIGARILKNYCHIWYLHPRICKHEFLTHTINFGMGSTFSKGLGSAFSEDPDPGPGPLYKVCRYMGRFSNLRECTFKGDKEK